MSPATWLGHCMVLFKKPNLSDENWIAIVCLNVVYFHISDQFYKIGYKVGYKVGSYNVHNCL